MSVIEHIISPEIIELQLQEKNKIFKRKLDDDDDNCCVLIAKAVHCAFYKAWIVAMSAICVICLLYSKCCEDEDGPCVKLYFKMTCQKNKSLHIR